MYSSYSLKDKYPYWWAIKEQREYEQLIERLVYEAEFKLSQFVDTKLKDIDTLVRDIENRIHQTSFNIEATVNNSPMTNETINREIKKMVLSEFEKALR